MFDNKVVCPFCKNEFDINDVYWYDTDFSKEHDKHLLDILRNTESDFIYFNYLTSGDEVNMKLKEFIDGGDYKIIHINNKSLSGQGRKTNVKEVEEVIITNI